MLQKNGMGHIEIILSFIIFIVALVFALVFFSPSGGDRLIESTLKYSFSEIKQNTSINFEIVSVKINNEEIMEDVIGVKVEGVSSDEMETKVRTIGGVSLDSSRIGDLVFIKDDVGNWADIEFITIEFSEEFGDGGVGSVEHNEEFYDISSSEEKKVVSESRFLRLVSAYDSDYGILKESFNLPKRIDFDFSLVFSGDDEIKVEGQIPDGFETFVEFQRVEVLRENGERVFAELRVRIW